MVLERNVMETSTTDLLHKTYVLVLHGSKPLRVYANRLEVANDHTLSIGEAHVLDWLISNYPPTCTIMTVGRNYETLLPKVKELHCPSLILHQSIIGKEAIKEICNLIAPHNPSQDCPVFLEVFLNSERVATNIAVKVKIGEYFLQAHEGSSDEETKALNDAPIPSEI